jgi:hypothetical protein
LYVHHLSYVFRALTIQRIASHKDLVGGKQACVFRQRCEAAAASIVPGQTCSLPKQLSVKLNQP